MTNNKICVYAIAKNEIKHAKRWYDSMKEADAVVVLDTGSTDGTPQTLRSLGATVVEKVYDHFRFDVARNDSLQLIPEDCNICVCVDLDEVFEPGWAEILRDSWIEGVYRRGLYPYVHDHLEDGSEGFVYNLDKIHSKNDSYWKYAVHEVCVTENLQKEECLYLSNIKLHHYADKSKSRLNYIDLLRERIEEDNTDYLGFLQYAMELHVQDFFEEAIVAFEKNLTLYGKEYSPIEIAAMRCRLGECYEKTNNQKAAIKNYAAGIAEDPEYRENYYCLAKIFAAANMLDAAIGVAQEGLQTSVRRYHWTEGVVAWAWGLYDILRHCYYEKQQYDLALSYANAALNLEPNNEILLKSYSLCLEAFINN